jgi:hypothetical protein
MESAVLKLVGCVSKGANEEPEMFAQKKMLYDSELKLQVILVEAEKGRGRRKSARFRTRLVSLNKDRVVKMTVMLSSCLKIPYV